MKKLLYILLLPIFVYGQTDTGWKDPTNAGVYIGAWTDPTNAFTSNNQYTTKATAPAAFYAQTDYSDFGMVIPAGATINGIEVLFEHYESSTGGTIAQISIWNNSNAGYSSAKSFTTSASEVTQTLGASNDLWGVTWIPEDFDDATGFIHLWIEYDSGTATKTIYIDHIAIKVYYTEAATGTAKNIFMGINF